MTQAPVVRDVILRDGSTMRLRAPGNDDVPALLAFFEALSPESLYLRFHGYPRVTPELLAPFVDADWENRGSLLATIDEEGEPRVVALASFTRLRDPAIGEVAFAVADELQGHGVGTRLLEQLAELAIPLGIRTFVAEVMSTNLGMLKVFADAGFVVARSVQGSTTEVTLDLEQTGAYVSSVDERDHQAVIRSLRPFFAPESVAVVGASVRRGSIGGELFRNVLAADFRGVAFPVNRDGEPVAGVRAYRTVSEIGAPVDLAVLCLPGEHVLEAAADALSVGVKALCVISAGFAETGAAGRARQEELLALTRAHGARLIGPNCLGLAVSSVGLNATFGPAFIPSGNVAFSSQSGALGLAFCEVARERGLGLSAFVSIGNKADVSSNDLLEHFEEDPGTDVILLYLESFGNPRKFGRLARRVARRKPIVALKGGRTGAGARAAGSHTAALTASETGVEALFRQAGVTSVDSLEELVGVTALLASQPLPRGDRVCLFTNAGGLGILGADACEAEGLELASLAEETRERLRALLPAEASVSNPVDMLGSATAATFEEALPIVLADPGVDATIVLFVPPVIADTESVASAVARAAEQAASGKPVLGVFISHDGTPEILKGDRRVASFAYPESAVRALARAAERSAWLRRPAGVPAELDRIDRDRAAEIVERALAGTDGAWLETADARDLLEAYGIPVVPERVVESADAAAAAARELGFPAVLKSAAAGAHKTEQGLVALRLETEEEVREAFARIGAPSLVQPMVEGGAELLAGAVQDPVFGPLVGMGPGGILAELIGEVEFRLAPLTDVDAREVVHAGKTGRLVDGFRGAPASDADALVDLLLRLAALADAHPEVSELDLNPVVGRPEGCTCVDARIRVERPRGTVPTKTW